MGNGRRKKRGRKMTEQMKVDGDEERQMGQEEENGKEDERREDKK
jgi:hypothetical protein